VFVLLELLFVKFGYFTVIFIPRDDESLMFNFCLDYILHFISAY